MTTTRLSLLEGNISEFRGLKAKARKQRTEVRKRPSEMRFACHSCEFHPNTVVPPYPDGIAFAFHWAGGYGGVKKSRVGDQRVE